MSKTLLNAYQAAVAVCGFQGLLSGTAAARIRLGIRDITEISASVSKFLVGSKLVSAAGTEIESWIAQSKLVQA